MLHISRAINEVTQLIRTQFNRDACITIFRFYIDFDPCVIFIIFAMRYIPLVYFTNTHTRTHMRAFVYITYILKYLYA